MRVEFRLPQAFGLALACLLFGVAYASSAEHTPIFASEEVKSPNSTARLLAGGTEQDGTYLAALEIDLKPNTITYWRQPGESGVPPQLDFSRSKNVASVEVLYPAPKRIEEAGSFVAGYDSKVVFPLRVKPNDPSAPVVMDLSLDYAACDKMCLPARARLALPLPRDAASPFAGDIAAALTRVPRKISQEEAKELFALSRRRGENLSWRLDYLGKDNARDVFAEAPDPLYLDAAPSADGKAFDLTLATNGTGDAPKTVRATLTIVTDKSAFEAPVDLQ